MRWTPLLAGCFSLLLSACRPHDDRYEPNDTLEAATPLPLDGTLTAVAVQDNPDCFVVDVLRTGRLTFRVRGVAGPGYRPSVTMFGPSRDEIVVAQPPTPDGATREQSQDRATFTLTVPQASPGRYWLRVMETHAADNMFPFAWRYDLTAHLES
jgi:hypothetical protein